MKKIYHLLLAGTVSLCACTDLPAQEFKEHVSKQFTVNAKNTEAVLAVYNIFGSIKVEGYDGDKVLLEIDKKITAKSQDEVDKGKEEFKFEIEQLQDSIVLYVAAPNDSRPRRSWDRNEDRRNIRYKYYLDLVVKVPQGIRLRVSTVNDGNIQVSNVFGNLFVSNVNGSIDIENAKGITKATTVNGKLNVSYAANPPAASTYHTINGDITVYYKTNLDAELFFKSMNGSYYTDFDNAEPISNTLVKNGEKNDKGTVYKIVKNAGVKIGNGGKQFHFETLNGNVYIKKS
ncbi:hypothetical protein [Sediminibacterium goheungense]|uniref:Adhesin n=1 Tax=Sediminibacterium goheungense TaxID=1086393 RepID=A0A4R6J3S6_9BACT|nr:hypothetical protein [Sediminibacterium goheungense]TDO28845.1 hypothetical protein BC659_0925 [Sediminibacterium goheungense]